MPLLRAKCILNSGYDCFLFNFTNQAPVQSCRSIATASAITTGRCTSLNGNRPISTATLNLPLTSKVISVTSSYSYFGRGASATVVTNTITSLMSISSITALAPIVQLNWKASDRKEATATSSSGGASSEGTFVGATGSTTPASTISVDSTPVAVPLPARGGLSTDGKVAIGVLVPVVILALVAVLTVVFRRRKQRLGRKNSTETPHYQDKPELDASSASKTDFVGSVGPAELSEPFRPQELEPQVRHELAAPDFTHELDSSARKSLDHSDGISQHS